MPVVREPVRDDLPPPVLATTDRAWHALAAAAVEAWRGSEALEGLTTENVLAAPASASARRALGLSALRCRSPTKRGRGSLIAARSIRGFAAHRVDAIISTSPPPTAHLVASALARRLQVPWIADYRDPWSQRSTRRRAGALDGVEARSSGARCRRPPHVVTVSAPIADDLRRLLGRPVSVVPNGFDPGDRARRRDPAAADRGRSLHAGLHRHADARHRAIRGCCSSRSMPSSPAATCRSRRSRCGSSAASRRRATDSDGLAGARLRPSTTPAGAARHRPRRPAASPPCSSSSARLTPPATATCRPGRCSNTSTRDVRSWPSRRGERPHRAAGRHPRRPCGDDRPRGRSGAARLARLPAA